MILQVTKETFSTVSGVRWRAVSLGGRLVYECRSETRWVMEGGDTHVETRGTVVWTSTD